MSEDKNKTWQVTLPYDDVRGMEARCEVLSEIETRLKQYIHLPLSDSGRKLVSELLEKIKGTRKD